MNQSRVSKGVPSGGQYATTYRPPAALARLQEDLPERLRPVHCINCACVSCMTGETTPMQWATDEAVESIMLGRTPDHSGANWVIAPRHGAYVVTAVDPESNEEIAGPFDVAMISDPPPVANYSIIEDDPW